MAQRRTTGKDTGSSSASKTGEKVGSDSAIPLTPGVLRFHQFLAARGRDLGLDPLSDDGLRLQAEFLGSGDIHPLDTLRELSLNPFVKPSERISAAKALLEYTARKVPAQLQLANPDGTALTLDASAFARLSEAELSTLQALLEKAQA